MDELGKEIEQAIQVLKTTEDIFDLANSQDEVISAALNYAKAYWYLQGLQKARFMMTDFGYTV